MRFWIINYLKNFVPQIFEIRIHGRAGQGAKSASEFLAEAALAEGKYVQAFSQFGPERGGAPVVSYVRISNEPIKIHSPVEHAEAVIVIDPTLTKSEKIGDGLADDGVLIMNTVQEADDVRKEIFVDGKSYARVHAMDASGISLKIIGKDIPNTVLIGALVKATEIISLDSILKITEKEFLPKLGEKLTRANLDAIKKGYEAVK